jgi:hypothetical protein
MATPSTLGQGIALQGKLDSAQRVGRLAFQAAQADKARAAKADVAAANAAKELEKNFKIDGSYNRLVAPDLIKTASEYIDRLHKLKTSGNPSWVNEGYKLANEFDLELVKYKSLSDEYNKFDAQTQSLDKNKVYFTKNFKNYLVENGKATSHSELQGNLAKKGIKNDPFFQINEDGIPKYRGASVIPVENELETDANKLDKTIASSYNTPIGEGGVKTTMVQQRPVRIASAQKAYEDNPQLYPDGRPRSLEDISLAYITQRPEAMVQLVDSKNLGFEVDPNTGYYTPEDQGKLNEYLLKYLEEYSNPTVKTSTVKGRSVFNFGDSEKQSVMSRTKTKNILKLGKEPSGAEIEYYTHDEYGLPADGYSGVVTGQTSNADGTAASGAVLSDKKVIQSVVLPYGQVTENGVTRTYPIQKGAKVSSKYILGVAPFVMFGKPGQYYYIPARNFSSSGLIGNKQEAGIVDENIQAQKNDAAKATTLFNQKLKADPALKKLIDENKYQEINDYINNLYLNGQ